MSSKSRINSVNKFYILHKKEVTLVSELLLVLVFAIGEWYFKHRFFSIFIVVVYFLASFLTNKRYLDFIFPLLLLFIVFNTSTIDYLLQLRKIDIPTIRQPEKSLDIFFTPNAGLEVLPHEVQTMLTILNATKIEEYKLDQDIYHNGEVMQRIVESAWPIKMDEASPYIFIPARNTDQYQTCSIMKTVEDISLVDCR